MKNTIKVSPQFHKDFETVAAHYGLKESGEYDWFKQDVKTRMADMGPWVEREAKAIRESAR